MTLKALVLVLMSLVIGVASADAKPRKHKRHYSYAYSYAYNCQQDDRYPEKCNRSSTYYNYYYSPRVTRGAARKHIAKVQQHQAQPKQVAVAGTSLISRARQYLGATAYQLGLPATQWCSDFMNKITGGGTGSRLARSWERAGRRLAGPSVGAVAVYRRGGNRGHVGIVTAVHGNTITLISGNDGGRVRERERSVRGAVFVSI